MAEALGIFQVAIVVALSLTGRDLFISTAGPKPPKKNPGNAMDGGGAAGSSGPVGPNIKFLICYG